MKKIKIIKCPKCRRTIPADEYRTHYLSHKGKVPLTMKTFGNKQSKISTAHMIAQETPGFGEFFKQFTSSQPKISDMSEAQIKETFEAALRDVDTTYTSLRLDATTEPEFIEVFIDEKRNLLLKYSPLALQTVSEEGIIALLLHEACHVATLPDSILRIPEIGGKEAMMFMKDTITNYDEYLAHVEFVNKFKEDKRYQWLKNQQCSLFKNFELIINATLTIINDQRKKGLVTIGTEWYVRQQLNSIAYDAMFFYVAKDASFLEWCKNQSLEDLGKFVQWTYEDFEVIRDMGLSLKESHDKVIVAGTLGLSTNPYLLLYGKIEFADETKKLHDEQLKAGRDTNIVELWEQRRKQYQSK